LTDDKRSSSRFKRRFHFPRHLVLTLLAFHYFFLQRFTSICEGPAHTPQVPSLVEISKTTAETSRFTGFQNHRLGNPMRQVGVRRLVEMSVGSGTVVRGSECNCCGGGGGPIPTAALRPGTPLPEREQAAVVVVG